MKAKKLLFLICLTSTSIGFAMNKEYITDYSDSYDSESVFVDNLKVYYKNLYGKSVKDINTYPLLSLAFQNDKINFSSHHSNDKDYCNEIEQKMKSLTIDTISFNDNESLKLMDIRSLEEAIHKKINKTQPKTSDSKKNVHLGQKPSNKTSIPKFYYGLGVGVVGTLAALKLLSWVRPAEQP